MFLIKGLPAIPIVMLGWLTIFFIALDLKGIFHEIGRWQTLICAHLRPNKNKHLQGGFR
ncbi:hypothetical protein ACQUFY_20705 [Robbsia andropogonis]|uniref:hypothetical protein n=1 Tax=Robbsia andropogonis TaxID=28092 RepID=UPI003D19DDF2